MDWLAICTCSGVAAGVPFFSDPMLTPDLEQQIADGTLKMAGNRSVEELERQRDTMLMEFVATYSRSDKAAQMAIASAGGIQARSK